MGDERGRTKKEWDEWWDELGQDRCDPVGYMGDDKLAEECKKFFTKYHWYWLSQMTMERYRGFPNEIAMRLCMNSYARYLLRGFAGHPDWTNQTALEATKLPAEERVAKDIYMIYGYKKVVGDDVFDRPVKGADPLDGYLYETTTMRNGATRTRQLEYPVYPGIEQHSMC